MMCLVQPTNMYRVLCVQCDAAGWAVQHAVARQLQEKKWQQPIHLAASAAIIYQYALVIVSFPGFFALVT
jgi:hypothetical protein